MKIIFAGTPDFAASALAALLNNAGNEIVAVLTQPDRPAGRGMQLTASPVKQLAGKHGLMVLQPTTLKTPEIQQQLAALHADIMIVAAYGLILPQVILDMPKFGCLNIHASLLPRWRGAAPIQRAILAGDRETGITIMQMDQGLDTGAMLLKKRCPITETDTAASLHDTLAQLGARSIVEALQMVHRGELLPTPQDNDFATYAGKLSKAEARIDWTQTANQIERMLRAYNPFPGAFSEINATPIKIWRATVVNEISGLPGSIIQADKEQFLVACGRGGLRLEILQRPGGKALPFAAFLQGFQLASGDQFQ